MLGLKLKLGLSCVQQAGGGGEEVPAWLEDFLGPNDEVPFAVADFENGNYWLDGAEVAVGDLFETVGALGDWRPQDIVAEQGLPCLSDANTAACKNSVSAALCADGFTAMFLFSNDEKATILVGMAAAPGFTHEMRATPTDLGACNLFDGGGENLVGTVPTHSHKMAATLSLTNLAASLNGQDVVAVEPPPEIPTPNIVWLKTYCIFEEESVGFLRAVSLFLPPFNNADLDDLTAWGPWRLENINVNASGITEYVNEDVTQVIGDITFSDCTSLANFDCPILVEIVGNVTFVSCALNQATVDAILVMLAAFDGTGGTTTYDNHEVNLSGGTSAVPSATGLAAKATLEGRGCTVTVNE